MLKLGGSGLWHYSTKYKTTQLMQGSYSTNVTRQTKCSHTILDQLCLRTDYVQFGIVPTKEPRKKLGSQTQCTQVHLVPIYNLLGL